MTEEIKEPKHILDDTWDADMVSAADAVLDGMMAARQIYYAYVHETVKEEDREKIEIPLQVGPSREELFEIYDRLQEELRTPILVQESQIPDQQQ